jgi:peptide subunit release factor 1 (eRF1)
MAEEIERRTETGMVRELIAAQTMPRAALGLTQTLNALAAHRVHHLFLASDFTASGDDPRFQQVVAASEPRETTATELISDTREWLMDRALEQAARVEIVSGEAAMLLDEHDGIGAWNRW